MEKTKNGIFRDQGQIEYLVKMNDENSCKAKVLWKLNWKKWYYGACRKNKEVDIQSKCFGAGVIQAALGIHTHVNEQGGLITTLYFKSMVLSKLNVNIYVTCGRGSITKYYNLLSIQGEKFNSKELKKQSIPPNKIRKYIDDDTLALYCEVSFSYENSCQSKGTKEVKNDAKVNWINHYNPKSFDLNPKNARYFVIKSLSKDDIHRSIKYEIWRSTEHGNKRLDAAYRACNSEGPIYLLFSVDGSRRFCGLAQMLSGVDYSNTSSNLWAHDKFIGQFKVKWIYVKDVPNKQLRHIRLENNENKSITLSRDTREVPPEKGKQVHKILHSYAHTTSIFDDFIYHEKREEEEVKMLSNQVQTENLEACVKKLSLEI